MLRRIVSAFHEVFPIGPVMRTLETLTRINRYQASAGILEAAAIVAHHARRAGLTGVQSLEFPADGKRRWWTFRAPVSWTPLNAILKVDGDDDALVRFPEQRCSLATYSSATPRDGVTARLVELGSDVRDDDLRGAVAIVPKARGALSVAMRRMERAGGRGFVSDLTSQGGDTTGEEQTGRLELRPDTGLLGFSVTPSQMTRLLGAARRGARAWVVVEIDRNASMPVVVGHLPGTSGREILLSAHLCHPAPGANDNASGVAALLGIAEILARARGPRRIGVRFVWGPEFVGLAAYLNQYVREGITPVPEGALILDMVGENQQKCAGPMVLEGPPPHIPSFFSALGERCAESLPDTGAVDLSPPSAAWRFRSAEFRGTSDHALFADRSIARPAILLTHQADRFNHSSADTLDKVDPAEVRRAGVIAGTMVHFLSTANRATIRELEAIVTAWGVKTIANAAELAQRTSDETAMVLGAERVAHATTRVVSALKSLPALSGRGDGVRRRRLIRAAERAGERATLLGGASSGSVRPAGGPVLVRRWEGPFNLRGLLDDVAWERREWFEGALERSKDAYGVALALALAIDDASDRQTVIRRATFTWSEAIDPVFAERFFETLREVGWVGESART
jgi:hypothetical protein